MVGVMTLLIVGLVFGRKQFAYLEVAPGLYIIEVVTAALLCTTVVGGFVAATPVRRAWSKNVMSHLPRPLLLCSGVCLLLAVGKAVTHFASGGQAAGLQELPILVYPAIYPVLVLWMSQRSPSGRRAVLLSLEYAILLFPVYFLVMHATGALEMLSLLNRPLWPNNNFVFSTCLLAIVFCRGAYPTWVLLVSSCCALIGIMLEAERGAFVCLGLAALVLVRRGGHAVQLGAVALAGLVIVAAFGEQLSYRFEGGLDDAASFFSSIAGGSDDPRYSSTEQRREMWSQVVEDVGAAPDTLLIGKPLSTSIVAEAWRNPHNGYVSALGRGGVFGLLFYLTLLVDATWALWMSQRDLGYPLCHLLYFCGCVDALTQTVFDSPYSLFLVICAGACSVIVRAQHPQPVAEGGV